MALLHARVTLYSRLQHAGRLGVDEGLHEALPIGKDEVDGDCLDMLEEALAGAGRGSGVDPELFETIADRVTGEGQEVHGGEHHGEVLLAVAEIVFEVVAVVLENVDAFVLNLPSQPGTGAEAGDALAGDWQRGHEDVDVGDLALGVRNGNADPIDETAILAVAERRAFEPAIARGQAFAGDFLRNRMLVAGGPLHEIVLGLERERFGGEEKIAAALGDGLGDWLAGEEIVIKIDWPQTGEPHAGCREPALAGVAHAILLLRAVLGRNELRHLGKRAAGWAQRSPPPA